MAVVLVASAAIVASLAVRGGSAGGPLSGEDVAVLMPQVVAVESTSLLSAASVHEELLAQLHAMNDRRVVAVPWAESVDEMRRFLTRVGDDYQPAWIVAVSIRAAAGEVRVIAVVYRGADYSVVETVTGNYSFDTEARALLELPREIAADVVRALGG
ncbi:MAG: hypothetical protein O2956_01430 [Gemmatimonadetes bacterium]|nr:hypothetical protein [Gemmatimonadota bacterium]